MHKKEDISVLLNDEYFQIVKFNVFNETVCPETRLAVPLEVGDVGVKPDRLAEIKLVTDLIDCAKNFVCARF